MGKFEFTKTDIDGVYIIKPKVFGDNRGYFFESYNEKDFKEFGINNDFIQDNQSFSCKGVLRGLHLQNNFPQAKLVRVIEGEVFDVCVDLRKDSSSYGKWVGVVLSGKNNKQFFIPRGFAHGFLVLSDTATFTYKCDEFYHPEDETGILWSDSEICIDWPTDGIENLTISDKDLKLKSFSEL